MSKKYNYKEISNILFKNKSEYKNINDQSKIDNFFIINRKLSAKFPEQSKFLNHKNIDKASAMDLWFKFIHKKGINYTPKWWWLNSHGSKKKSTSNITKRDREIFMKYNTEINPRYLDFLFENNEEEVKEELKLLKKFEKRGKK